MNKVHIEEIEKLRERFEEQEQEKERQNIKKILSINNDHGRKEQSYKDMIERLMAALSAAQKQQKSMHSKLNNQMQMVTKTLQSVLASNRQGKKISNGVKNLVD